MKLILYSIQFLPGSARALSVLASVCAIVNLNTRAQAAEPFSAVTQSDAPTTGFSFTGRTNTLPTPSQPATNGLKTAPTSGTTAVATNLSQTAATISSAALDDKYKLTIGDRLSFRILEDEDDPKPLLVTDSGDVEVPYLGRFPAEGKTCLRLAAEIKTALDKDYYYHATVVIAVDLMTRSHGRVYLVGAVRSPGPVEIPNDEVLTLSKAVLRAGGFTDYADRRHVKVTRKDAAAKTATGTDNKKTFVLDVGEIFDKGKIESDLTLEPGDLIYVPDRLIRF